MVKETFNANPRLIAEYLLTDYVAYLEAQRKSKMEGIIKMTQDYADEPHRATNKMIYYQVIPRLNKELKEIETELEHLSTAEEEGNGFVVDLSKVTFWEAK